MARPLYVRRARSGGPDVRSGAAAQIGRALLCDDHLRGLLPFKYPIQGNRHPSPPSTPRSTGRELEVLSAGKVGIVVHLRDGLESATASMTVRPTMVVRGTCTAAAPFTLIRQAASSTHCVVPSASVQRRRIFTAEALDLGFQVGGHRAGASGQHPTCHGLAKGTVQIGHEAQIRGEQSWAVASGRWRGPLLMFHMRRGQIADRMGNVGGRV